MAEFAPEAFEAIVLESFPYWKRFLPDEPRKPGDPNPTLKDLLVRVQGRLRNHEVTIPEDWVDPSPESDREDLIVVKTAEENPTDTLQEIRDSIGLGGAWSPDNAFRDWPGLPIND